MKPHFFIPVLRRYTQYKKFTICLQTFKKNWWQADILSWMPQMLLNHHFLMSASLLGMKNKDDFLFSSCRCLKEWKMNNASSHRYPRISIGFVLLLYFICIWHIEQVEEKKMRKMIWKITCCVMFSWKGMRSSLSI